MELRDLPVNRLENAISKEGLNQGLDYGLVLPVDASAPLDIGLGHILEVSGTISQISNTNNGNSSCTNPSVSELMSEVDAKGFSFAVNDGSVEILISSEMSKSGSGLLSLDSNLPEKIASEYSMEVFKRGGEFKLIPCSEVSKLAVSIVKSATPLGSTGLKEGSEIFIPVSQEIWSLSARTGQWGALAETYSQGNIQLTCFWVYCTVLQVHLGDLNYTGSSSVLNTADFKVPNISFVNLNKKSGITESGNFDSAIKAVSEGKYYIFTTPENEDSILHFCYLAAQSKFPKTINNDENTHWTNFMDFEAVRWDQQIYFVCLDPMAMAAKSSVYTSFDLTNPLKLASCLETIQSLVDCESFKRQANNWLVSFRAAYEIGVNLCVNARLPKTVVCGGLGLFKPVTKVSDQTFSKATDLLSFDMELYLHSQIFLSSVAHLESSLVLSKAKTDSTSLATKKAEYVSALRKMSDLMKQDAAVAKHFGGNLYGVTDSTITANIVAWLPLLIERFISTSSQSTNGAPNVSFPTNFFGSMASRMLAIVNPLCVARNNATLILKTSANKQDYVEKLQDKLLLEAVYSDGRGNYSGSIFYPPTHHNCIQGRYEIEVHPKFVRDVRDFRIEDRIIINKPTLKIGGPVVPVVSSMSPETRYSSGRLVTRINVRTASMVNLVGQVANNVLERFKEFIPNGLKPSDALASQYLNDCLTSLRGLKSKVKVVFKKDASGNKCYVVAPAELTGFEKRLVGSIKSELSLLFYSTGGLPEGEPEMVAVDIIEVRVLPDADVEIETFDVFGFYSLASNNGLDDASNFFEDELVIETPKTIEPIAKSYVRPDRHKLVPRNEKISRLVARAVENKAFKLKKEYRKTNTHSCVDDTIIDVYCAQHNLKLTDLNVEVISKKLERFGYSLTFKPKSKGCLKNMLSILKIDACIITEDRGRKSVELIDDKVPKIFVVYIVHEKGDHVGSAVFKDINAKKDFNRELLGILFDMAPNDIIESDILMDCVLEGIFSKRTVKYDELGMRRFES